MSDLRTRIAAVIYHTAAAWDQDWPWESLVDHVKVIYLEQADAVIRDVLTPEFLADLVIAAVQKAADDGVNP
jgi:hypothetical protein